MSRPIVDGTAGRLAGKRALITGAASGIGRATAIRFAAEGARVALLDIDIAGVTALAASLMADGEAYGVVADITDEASVKSAVGESVARLGGLDVVVANAGIELSGEDAAVHELDLAVWRRTIDTNLTGCFLTCKHTVPFLLAEGGGSVVITGSPDGIYGVAIGSHAYSASKAGCHGLARIMAAEYARRGIRVNVVLPGWIDTPLNDAWVDVAGADGLAAELERIPLGRMGSPAEVASMITFLASDEASYATGAFFPVDGGQTAI